MKKIMYNDKYGLTDAVLEGRKTVTRRIVPDDIIECVCSTIIDGKLLFECRDKDDAHIFIKPTYKVCEVVAVSQCYKNIMETLLEPNGMVRAWIPESAGFRNKMFVKAELMPHQIEILDVRVERLHDITDEDCIKEGIQADEDNYFFRYDPNGDFIFTSPREAFAELIDKVGKKGTWKSNPYVFRYEFKLK